MIDREKVAKGLECCSFISGNRKCNECPYQKDNSCYQMQDDYHALLFRDRLKEREALNVIYSYSEFGDHLPHCPSCKKTLPNRSVYGKSSFCYACGQAVKWE